MEKATIKNAAVPFTDEGLNKVYPIAELLEGWYFIYYDISNVINRVAGIN